MTKRWQWTTWQVLFAMLWSLGALLQYQKMLQHGALFRSRPLLIFLLECGVALACLFLCRFLAQWKMDIHAAWLAVYWLAISAIYFALYPAAQRRILSGQGSDSEDALRIAASRLVHLQFPYSQLTCLHNPITPMPGAVLLSLPFYVLGRVSLQNLFWLVAFIVLCLRFFRRRSTAVVFLLCMTVLNLQVLNHFAVGADYICNVMYVSVAVLWFVRSFSENPRSWRHIASGIFLGIALSSRSVYVVLLPLLAAYLYQHCRSWFVTLRGLLIPVLSAAAITVPIYLWNPGGFSPLHVTGKVTSLPIPAAWSHLLVLLLPLLGILTACYGFRLHLTEARLFLLAGLAQGVMLLPPGIILLSSGAPPAEAMGMLAYLNSATLLIALALFSSLETDSVLAGKS